MRVHQTDVVAVLPLFSRRPNGHMTDDAHMLGWWTVFTITGKGPRQVVVTPTIKEGGVNVCRLLASVGEWEDGGYRGTLKVLAELCRTECK